MSRSSIYFIPSIKNTVAMHYIHQIRLHEILHFQGNLVIKKEVTWEVFRSDFLTSNAGSHPWLGNFSDRGVFLFKARMLSDEQI